LFAQLLSQSSNVCVDRAEIAPTASSPDIFKQLFARLPAPTPLYEHLKQPKFHLSQRQGNLAIPGTMCGPVET
jgi:hypothetical protein